MIENNPFSAHDASAKIGARQFHHQSNRDEIVNVIEKYDQQFLDPVNGMLMSDLSRERRCPACLADDYRVSFVKQGFRYCMCRKCAMLYVNPILTDEASNDAYKSGEVSNKVLDVLLSKTQRDFDEPKFVKALELIEGVMPENSGRQLLDIGCSVGHFLEVARGRDWNCTGIELNSASADYTESLGFEVIRKPLVPGLFAESSFDVVTMWDVLEHIPDPESVLNMISDLLAPNGILCLIVPNADSIAARMMREKCTMFRGSSHVNIFNRVTLCTLLERVGFKAEMMISMICEINVVNNWLTYQDPYQGDSEEKKSILGVIDEKTLHDNYLGYKLFCMAKKKKSGDKCR